MKNRLLQDYLYHNAEHQPNAKLIQDGAYSISYGDMNRTSNMLARYFIRRGLKGNDKVALLIPKNIDLFRCVFATLKAGATYVPLSLQAPLERNRFILGHSDCRFLCVDKQRESEGFQLLASQRGVELIIIDDKLPIEEEAGDNLPHNCLSDDLAYILYTSGSTGTPKGVMISHGSVMNYADWAVRFLNIKPHDRLSNHPGLHFDLSVFDIYSTLASGASLYPVPQSISMFPIKVVDFIESNKLTIWNSVPSLYSYMLRADVLKPKRLSTLRVLTFNGEVMPTATLIGWMRACPTARFINQYGPTETTCASLHYEIMELPTDPTIPIPLGRPIDNTEVFALTEELEVAQVGQVGELYIAGAGVGKGYLSDADRTAKAFVKNPRDPCSRNVTYRTGDLVKLSADDNYHFIGRRDHQVKVMGFRVELGEIESTLMGLAYISDAASLALPHRFTGDLMIVAFVVIADDSSQSSQIDDLTIKNDIGRLLPHFMVPREIVRLKSIPLNSNGKIDRAELQRIHRLPN